MDTDLLKKWLYVKWQQTRHAHFFLAGAVIGRVKDIFTLAKNYGIDEYYTEKFLNHFNISAECITPRDSIVVRRAIYRWSILNDVPPNIAEILAKAYEEKIAYFFGEIEVDEGDYKFMFEGGVVSSKFNLPLDFIINGFCNFYGMTPECFWTILEKFRPPLILKPSSWYTSAAAYEQFRNLIYCDVVRLGVIKKMTPKFYQVRRQDTYLFTFDDINLSSRLFIAVEDVETLNQIFYEELKPRPNKKEFISSMKEILINTEDSNKCLKAIFQLIPQSKVALV